MLAEINDYIIGRKKKEDDDENDPPGGSTNGEESTDSEKKTNEGTLILDATCVPSDIRFPTDISLLNEGRECLEGIVDELHELELTNGVKPRTYRQVARRDYLRFVRNRKPKRKLIRATIRKQLCYIRRDLAAIEACDIAKLSSKSQKQLAVVCKLYEQQNQMYETKTHQVPDRIVSIHQPWVRPIVRGKATADVEFGAEVAISVLNGYTKIERLSWDAYNESTTLQDTVERYKSRRDFIHNESSPTRYTGQETICNTAQSTASV